MGKEFVIVKGKKIKVLNKESLMLSHKNINDISEIKGLETLTNLKQLHLSNNQITEIKGLDNLTKLTWLTLGYNQITEIKGLDNLTEVEAVFLMDNQITEIKGLDNLKSLKLFFIENNPVADEVYNKWGQLKWRNRISVKDIPGLVEYCRQIPIEKEKAEKRKIDEKKEAKEHKETIEKEAVEKLKKMLKVSDSIKLEMMRKTLKLDEDTFNDKIFDWAADFNFRIDDDKIIINQETVDDFINALDKQFDAWGDKEQGKIGKLE